MTKPAPQKRRAEYGDNRRTSETHTFDEATHFTVTRKAGPGRFETQEFGTLTEALNAAWRDERVMVYAVTAEGRSFMISRTEWRFYYLRWKATVAAGPVVIPPDKSG